MKNALVPKKDPKVATPLALREAEVVVFPASAAVLLIGIDVPLVAYVTGVELVPF
jgi:hypothetical protein